MTAARGILDLAGKISTTEPVTDPGPDLGQTSEPGEAAPTQATDPAASPGSVSSPDPSTVGAAGRVLVVDDSSVSLSVVARVVEKMGHEPIGFTDGREALQSLATTSASIVLTDCEMPDFDGYELAEAVRDAEKGGDRHTPIVAVTGHSTLEVINRCFDVGMDDYLCKPVGIDELEVVVNRWLSPDDTIEGIEKTWLASAIPDDSSDGEGNLELVRAFCEAIRDSVGRMADLVENGDGAQVAALLPSMKSEAFMIGAYSFGRSCGQLQKAAAASDITMTLQKLGPFLASFVKLERAARAGS